MANTACECFFSLALGLWVSVAQHPQVRMWTFLLAPGLDVQAVEGEPVLPGTCCSGCCLGYG